LVLADPVRESRIQRESSSALSAGRAAASGARTPAPAARRRGARTLRDPILGRRPRIIPGWGELGEEFSHSFVTRDGYSRVSSPGDLEPGSRLGAPSRRARQLLGRPSRAIQGRPRAVVAAGYHGADGRDAVARRTAAREPTGLLRTGCVRPMRASGRYLIRLARERGAEPPTPSRFGNVAWNAPPNTSAFSSRHRCRRRSPRWAGGRGSSFR
jgi:hypothetical protein